MSDGPCRPLDMDELGSEPTEFCWGEGLEPLPVRGKPPREGGRCGGATPDCEPIIVSNSR